MEWHKQQSAIMTDNLSGSADITDATTQMVLCLLQEETNRPIDELMRLLQQISHEIITAQSGMAALVNLCNVLFSALDDQLDTAQNIDRLTTAVTNIAHKSTKYRQAAYQNAAALIPDAATVMTHSASSTVLKTLLHTQKSGKNINVIITEARPLCEGRQLAETLSNNGINTTLIVDAALYTNLPMVDIVLLGSDSLTTKGVVSKIGIAGLSVCAQSFGIPCYILSDSLKIWAARLGEQPIHERSPNHVWTTSSKNLTIQNHVYDITPWSAISGIVTEIGLQTPANIRAQCHLMEIHPLLVKVIAEVRSTI